MHVVLGARKLWVKIVLTNTRRREAKRMVDGRVALPQHFRNFIQLACKKPRY
jgi:hypothetical protein